MSHVMPDHQEMYRMRADSVWTLSLDEIAYKLRLANRTRVIDISVELLAAILEIPIPNRIQKEPPSTERFSAEDKARLFARAGVLPTVPEPSIT